MTTNQELDFTGVVKIFAARTPVSYAMPWQRRGAENSTGSGFILENKRIITNVHVIEDHLAILVRRHGSARRYAAKVLCMGWQCDLALITVEDPEFWANDSTVSLGELPNLQDSVACVGYPRGGDNVSVTCGVVSRVDTHFNPFCHTSLLTVQIDAAINSGNSGGPVFKGREVVGVAYSNLSTAQNVGYIIPVPILRHFLNDFEENGESQGFCFNIGFKVQPLENKTLRKYHKMTEQQTGVVIQKPMYLSPFYQHVKQDDILLEVDGVPIGDNGTISFRKNERITFDYLFTRKVVGDKVPLKILRQGEVLDIEPVALYECPNLIPRLHNYDCSPSFYIIGGLVFMPLSEPLLSQSFKSWANNAPTTLTWHYYYGNPEKKDEQIVVLKQILASELTLGYHAGNYFAQIFAFNGNPVRNIRELAIAVESFLDPYREDAARSEEEIDSSEHRKMLRFDIGVPGKTSIHIVLDPLDVLRQSPDILRLHQIPKTCTTEVSEAINSRKEAKSTEDGSLQTTNVNTGSQ